jgi:hypothetical protein
MYQEDTIGARQREPATGCAITRINIQAIAHTAASLAYNMAS